MFCFKVFFGCLNIDRGFMYVIFLRKSQVEVARSSWLGTCIRLPWWMVRKCWTVSWADKPFGWKVERDSQFNHRQWLMKDYQSFGLVGYHVWLWLYVDTSISAVSAGRRFWQCDSCKQWELAVYSNGNKRIWCILFSTPNANCLPCVPSNLSMECHSCSSGSEVRFGLRTVATKGREILLNGAPVKYLDTNWK